ncbi:hypothetical protein BDN72DRAFT_899472 [Pluteus cervinus]|uniref:Uncharacterized protein n=1 Tax=Pluteus cervinus TaxID=181527 RepID=A0ACD3AMW5_9AGAR|nr:hypothetical protein BDN72DRAFT_899472 [Pluteus cervinus]
MLLTDLPLDILELVVRCLMGDFATLKSLALVCRLFRDPCQQHILRGVEIGDRKTQTSSMLATSRCHRFIADLRSNPRFIRHLRSVSVCGSLDGSWLLENMDDVAEFLNLVSEARLVYCRITATTSVIANAGISWTQLSAPFREALSKVLDKIETLQLEGFSDLPVDILARYHKNITGLHLIDLNIVQGSSFTPGSFKLKLRSLKILNESPDVVQTLISSGILDLSQLKSLIFGSWRGMVNISPLLQSKDLRGLRLRWFTPDIAVDQSLCQLNELRKLIMDVRWKPGSSSPDLEWLAATLNAVQSPHLSTIKVTVVTHFIPAGGDFEIVKALSQPLDRLRNNLGGRLKTLGLTFWIFPSTADKFDEIKQRISEQIQWKGDSEVLDLSVIPPPGQGSSI